MNTTAILDWFSSITSLSKEVLITIGMVIIAILILKGLFGGGHSSSVAQSSGSERRQRGFPTSMYTGNSRLSNFNVKPEVYDFKVPSATPKTDNLRKSVNLNMDLASKLFIGNFKNPPKLDSEAAKELFTVKGLVDCPHELPKQMIDWNKAKELFIPHLKDETKEEEDEA